MMSLYNAWRHVVIVSFCASISLCNDPGLDFEWTAPTNPVQNEALNYLRGTFDNIVSRYPQTNGTDSPCILTSHDNRFNCLLNSLSTIRISFSGFVGPGQVLLNTTFSNKFYFEWRPMADLVVPSNAVRYGTMDAGMAYVARAFENNKWYIGVYLQSWACPRVLVYNNGYEFQQRCVMPEILTYQLTGLVLLGGSATSGYDNVIPSISDYLNAATAYAGLLDGNDVTCQDLAGASSYRFNIATPGSAVQATIVLGGVSPSCGEPMFIAYTTAMNAGSVVMQCSVTETSRSGNQVTCAITCQSPSSRLFLQILNQSWMQERIDRICEIDVNLS